MSITSPPRPARPSVVVDPDELEALVEALIEEARQRARRRRRRRGGWIALTILAAGGVYFGLERGGGSTAASTVDPNRGAAAGVQTGERWGLSHGPDGGPAFAVAVAPSESRIVYLGTGWGVYRSTNGGRSWVNVGPTLHVDRGARGTALLVDPHSPRTVYAGLNGRWAGGGGYGSAVYKTSDGGRTWRALRLRGQPIAITPTTVYAATGGPRETSRLVRSSDGGRSWQPADHGLPSTYVWGLAFDPSAPATMYAAMGPRGAFETSDGGGHWYRIGLAARWGDVTAIAVDPLHPSTLYGATNAGIVVSHDAGRSWWVSNATLARHDRDRWNLQVTALLVNPRNPRTLYASTRCAGVFKSNDGGHRWSAANTGLDPQCPLAYSLAFDPEAPRTIYAADPFRGVVKSTDGAAHWRVTNKGLSLAYVWSVAVAPQSPQTVYAGAGALGLFESDDGGAAWRPLATGLKGVYTFALDPHHPANLLAAGSSPTGSTAPSPDAIAYSTNGGRTWAKATFATRWVGAVALSGKRAYAGTADGFGVFGSNDRGRTWSHLGPPGVFYVQALAIDPGDPAVVYAGVLYGTTRGLWKSADGGTTWQHLTDALGIGVTAIAIDPGDPSMIYIGTSGGEGAVYKSTDGGQTWQPTNVGLRVPMTTRTGKRVSTTMAITAVAIDPSRPTTLYAATDGNGVYRSTDAGASWHPLNAGLTTPNVTTLALDKTGRTVYAGTISGGVVKLQRNP